MNAAHVKRSLPNEHFTKGTYKPSSDKTEDNLSKPSNSTSTMQVGDDYETLVTMFICKKAAAQFAGADKHFPGRPPTARPRGAPPPRTARSSQDKSIHDLTATLPARPNNRDRMRPDARGGKSPLLMEQLPPRKQQSLSRVSHNFGNSTYCGGLEFLGSSKRTLTAHPPPPRDASHGDSCETLNSTVVQTRSFAWGRTPHERNHEDQPIVTEAVRSTCPR